MDPVDTSGWPTTDVVIVGGGPVGLWLLAELQLRGVPTVLLERAAERPAHSRGIATHARTLEVLAMRGVAAALLAEGRPIPAIHFGMIPEWVDLSAIDSPFPFMLGLYQRRTEDLLEKHALGLGADLRRGHVVTAVHDAGDHVDVAIEGPDGGYGLRAGHVVGCDGAGSIVRRAAGIRFTGEPSTRTTFLADVHLERPPERPISHVGRNGSFVVVPMPDGVWRMVGFDPELMDIHREVPVTLEEVCASARRILGDDHGAHDPLWTARVPNAALQAEVYGRGRILLAGDAAHIHPPQGGQGLNLGVQDAMNLGWKLAAEVQGWAPAGLLDTYHAERHPAGAAVVASTLAQNGLAFALDAEERAVRDLVMETMRDVPAVRERLALQLSGLAVAYPSPDEDTHALTGRRVPDLALEGAPAPSVLPLLTDGRFHLLEPSGPGGEDDAALAGRVARHAAGFTGAPAAWAALTAVLVRPDGYVAWATDEADPARRSAEAAAALAAWCGAPGSA